MNGEKSNGRRKAKWSLLLISLLSSQLLSGQAQVGVRQGAAGFESELRARYRIESIRLPEANGQLRGSFQIMGDLTPRNLGGKTTATNMEATAVVFLEETKTLFGVADLSKELRKKSAVKDRHGATHISYHREVAGLPLEGMEVTTHLNSDGKVFAVTGHLIPVMPELTAATTAQRLALSVTQATARSAIEFDLKAGGIDPETVAQMSLEKVATADAPYVVWKADVILKSGLGRWLYRVDAFTGTVIAKRSNVQTLQRSSQTDGVSLTASTNRSQASGLSSLATKPTATNRVEKAPLVGTKEAVAGVIGVQQPESKRELPRQVAPLTGTKEELSGSNRPPQPQQPPK